MFSFLSPRLWIGIALVAALGFSHFTAYRKGKTHVQTEWQASIAQANAEARRLENARQSAADTAARLAAERARRIAADSARARAAASGLRNDLDALQRASQESLATANNAVRVLGDVFEQCVREYSRVAEEADRATSEVKQLREAWPR